MQVEAIIFDLGNVLMFHDNQVLMSRLGKAAGLCGEGIDRLISHQLWDDVHRGALDEQEIHREVCAALGVRIGPSEFFELWNCHFRLNDALLPYVERLVGRVKLLLLSNTNALHARYFFQQLPVLQKFDAHLLSHELKLMKPDRRIYEEALRRAGTRPEATAFFDDLPEYVEAARTLGIRGYVFRSVAEFVDQLSQMGLSLS